MRYCVDGMQKHVRRRSYLQPSPLISPYYVTRKALIQCLRYLPRMSSSDVRGRGNELIFFMHLICPFASVDGQA